MNHAERIEGAKPVECGVLTPPSLGTCPLRSFAQMAARREASQQVVLMSAYSFGIARVQVYDDLDVEPEAWET